MFVQFRRLQTPGAIQQYKLIAVRELKETCTQTRRSERIHLCLSWRRLDSRLLRSSLCNPRYNYRHSEDIISIIDHRIMESEPKTERIITSVYDNDVQQNEIPITITMEPLNSRMTQSSRLKHGQNTFNLNVGSLDIDNTDDTLHSLAHLQTLKELIPTRDTVDIQRQLYQQSSAEWCNDIETCPCILRIEAILNIYELYQDDIGIGRDIDQFFKMKNYSKTVLENDFQHIHQVNTTNLKEVVRGMRRKVWCLHYDSEAAAHIPMSSGFISRKATRRGLVDKIHSFFLQFRLHTIKTVITTSPMFRTSPLCSRGELGKNR